VNDLQSQIDQGHNQIADLQSLINERENHISELQFLVSEKNEEINNLKIQLEELAQSLPKGEWTVIKTFIGTGDKTTASFNVPSGTWRVIWLYSWASRASLDLYVYPEGASSGPVATVSSRPSTSGMNPSGITDVSAGPGNFYITVQTKYTEWALIIEALIPKT